MKRLWILTLGAAAFAASTSAQDAPKKPEPADHAAQMQRHDSHDDMLKPKVPTLLTGYGVGGFAVTTSVPQAQAFFSNGMELGAAFAHSAAGAAMEHAVMLDPACAMCKWGEALVEGPTINYGKDKKERKPLFALAARSRSRGDPARHRERTRTDRRAGRTLPPRRSAQGRRGLCPGDAAGRGDSFPRTTRSPSSPPMR